MKKYYELGSKELAEQIHKNQKFVDAMAKCDSVKELYDLYIKYDYTNVSYEEFEKYFAVMKAVLESIEQTNGVSEKLKNDKKFLEEVKKCKTEKELYDKYIEYKYTNLSPEDFKKAFKTKLDAIAKEGTIELSEEQLDAVVGGSVSEWFSRVTNLIPIVGGFVATTIDIACGNVKGAGNIAARFAGATLKAGLDMLGGYGGAGILEKALFYKAPAATANFFITGATTNYE